ncbi:class IV adenylate cyclase [Desulfolutivibrio sulfoxidireducens]|uniref:class IV adenylate cyclase n=1 Tax=Desulfolutivibrio sulfoxidireducens TaxID=2773299 RepID=UPI00159E0C1E|nr:class IV adenylate cyclase [Desulfolutivibrio sulfoxidireducens]QLA16394.1 CYTH domain-containing protein [Desulfolutivibrio sulfoxidireducens]QLA19725.1 CYTH domain-containing protein [Desulfolutivibrio sulfoxidireducens]
MALEVELKYPVLEFAPVRRALAGIGAQCLGAVFERNEVFDSPAPGGDAQGASGRLRDAGMVLRLRQDIPGKSGTTGGAGHCGLLTLKLPPPPGAPEGFKVRREIETRVEDLAAMRDILSGLGFAGSLCYEKVRETWKLGELSVCLDRLPFGCFVELEGPPGDILAWADRLGLQAASASTATYHDLHLEHLDRLGLPRRDSFVFDPDTAALLVENPALGA